VLVQLSVLSPGKITFCAVQVSFIAEFAFKLTGST